MQVIDRELYEIEKENTELGLAISALADHSNMLPQVAKSNPELALELTCKTLGLDIPSGEVLGAIKTVASTIASIVKGIAKRMLYLIERFIAFIVGLFNKQKGLEMKANASLRFGVGLSKTAVEIIKRQTSVDPVGMTFIEVGKILDEKRKAKLAPWPFAFQKHLKETESDRDKKNDEIFSKQLKEAEDIASRVLVDSKDEEVEQAATMAVEVVTGERPVEDVFMTNNADKIIDADFALTAPAETFLNISKPRDQKEKAIVEQLKVVLSYGSNLNRISLFEKMPFTDFLLASPSLGIASELGEALKDYENDDYRDTAIAAFKSDFQFNNNFVLANFDLMKRDGLDVGDVLPASGGTLKLAKGSITFPGLEGALTCVSLERVSPVKMDIKPDDKSIAGLTLDDVQRYYKHYSEKLERNEKDLAKHTDFIDKMKSDSTMSSMVKMKILQQRNKTKIVLLNNEIVAAKEFQKLFEMIIDYKVPKASSSKSSKRRGKKRR